VIKFFALRDSYFISYQQQPLEGFLYVTDLTTGENLDPNYTRGYRAIVAIPGTKWFKFQQ
jgi:hypothetical protein